MDKEKPASSKVIRDIGNSKEIDRYNQFRYERPTYLTVSTNSQK